MSTHVKTIIFVVGVMLGIVCGEVSLYASEVAVGALLLAVAQGVLLVLGKQWAIRSGKRDTEGVALTLLTLLFSLGIFFGIIRVELALEKQRYVCETSCTFDAVIVSSPETKEAFQIFNVHPVGEATSMLDVQLRTPLYPKYEIGQTVSLSGKVTIPDVIAPHGDKKSFDYQAYLLTRNVGSVMTYPRIETKDSETHTFSGVLGRWKDSLVARIETYVSSPASALASGMLFGTASMSQELTQTFRIAGLSHIIVLSGFNIAVLIAAILFVLGFLPLVVRIMFASGMVILFVMMVGAEASVIRATLMALVSLLAMLIGRAYVARQALMLSLVAIVIYEPYALLHDVSLHLSFLATAGIVYASAPLLLFFRRYIPRVPALHEMCATTIAAYVGTLPYIMYTFGTVSVYALIANMLVLPFVSLAMLLTFLVVLSSYLSTHVALLFGLLNTLLNNFMISIARMIEYLPFSSFLISISFSAMCTMYICVAFAVAFLIRKQKDETHTTNEDGVLTDTISY